MRTNETLRFINDSTFQEATPPEDRSSPLEWRRSFNTVSFEVQNPAVEYVYAVNEIDHFVAIERGSDHESRRVVSASPRRHIRVNFELPQEKLRDSILYTEETEKDSGIYKLRRIRGSIQISFTDREPTEPRGPYEQGAFPGLAFKTDFETASDSLSVEVSAPSQQIEEIAALLKSGYANAIHVTVGIQSFSYEVDDALREWYHPQDLFIHGNATQAVLLSMRVRRQQPKPDPLSDEPAIEEDEQITVAPLPPALPQDYSTILRSIKTALWAVAALLLLAVLKKG
jgi:hypothetical protein